MKSASCASRYCRVVPMLSPGKVDPTSRVLLISFGRGVIHGLRPEFPFTWCGKLHPTPRDAQLGRAVAVTCRQCQTRGQVSRGHAELINKPAGGSDATT